MADELLPIIVPVRDKATTLADRIVELTIHCQPPTAGPSPMSPVGLEVGWYPNEPPGSRHFQLERRVSFLEVADPERPGQRRRGR